MPVHYSYQDVDPPSLQPGGPGRAPGIKVVTEKVQVETRTHKLSGPQNWFGVRASLFVKQSEIVRRCVPRNDTLCV